MKTTEINKFWMMKMDYENCCALKNCGWLSKGQGQGQGQEK